MQSKVQKSKTSTEAVYYAVGGDGTFQSLVNAVDLENAVLQYLPYGSGNNAYITFYNQPFDLKRDILCEDTFKADLGKANGEYFVTMFGLALDSNIGKNLSKFKRLPISGKAKYYTSIFYTLLFNSEPVNTRMTVDSKTEEKVSSFISITNGPTTGGQTPVSPHSSAFDGKLNALVADKLSFMQALKLFSKIKTGEHLNDPKISQYLFENMVFESLKPLMYEIDGEIRHAKKIKIEACKNAITLKGRKHEHRH
jgi:diacylglycerol kinase family enzyme